MNTDEDHGDTFIDENDIIQEFTVYEEDLPDAVEDAGSDDEVFDEADDLMHIFTGLTDMSTSNMKPPPFVEDDEIAGAVPVVVTPSKGQTVTPSAATTQQSVPQHKEVEVARDPPKRNEHDRDRRDDPLLKKPRLNKDGMPPPPPNPAVILCGRLAHANISEAEAHVWSSASLDANNTALTKIMCEAFVRQASHAKEIKGLASLNAKLLKENQVLKFKVNSVEEEKRELCETYKEIVKLELGGLRKELCEEKTKTTLLGVKVASLEKALEEAKLLAEAEAKSREDEVASLTAQLEAAPDEVFRKELLIQGQVKFMKSFIRKLPDFDWNLLGAATAGYAEDLKMQMAKEAARKAQEAEELRLASEGNSAA